VATPTYARLGETAAQIEEGYGEPVTVEAGHLNILDKRFGDLLDKKKQAEIQKQGAENNAIIKNNLKGY